MTECMGSSRGPRGAPELQEHQETPPLLGSGTPTLSTHASQPASPWPCPPPPAVPCTATHLLLSFQHDFDVERQRAALTAAAAASAPEDGLERLDGRQHPAALVVTGAPPPHPPLPDLWLEGGRVPEVCCVGGGLHVVVPCTAWWVGRWVGGWVAARQMHSWLGQRQQRRRCHTIDEGGGRPRGRVQEVCIDDRAGALCGQDGHILRQQVGASGWEQVVKEPAGSGVGHSNKGRTTGECCRLSQSGRCPAGQLAPATKAPQGCARIATPKSHHARNPNRTQV